MRWLRHWMAPSAQRVFPEASLERIAAAIAASEAGHRGQICFAVESRLSLTDLLAERDPRDAAREAFARLRVWDTAANSGVLLYLLLADHRIEIVADRGYGAQVGAERWRSVCELAQRALAEGRAEQAVLGAIAALSQIAEECFPRAGGADEGNELPDRPARL